MRINPNSNPNSSSLTYQQAQVPDIAEEIIVINREATTEALTALSAGFPADSLTEEEIEAGVIPVIGGIEQVNYTLIRNHIISKWRENINSWITKEMFLNSVPDHCHGLLDSAYNYLVSRGYINFGVSQAIKEKIPSEFSKGRVIIAKQLMRSGFKITVLEGRKRPGGRVYTKKMELDGGGANRVSASADLGGSVLTGTLGNPLGILARQLGLEASFNRLLDKASRLRQLMGEVSVDVSLGAALETFRQVYGDDPYDMGGDHCFLPGGNGRLVQALAENVPILYEKTVHTIRYGVDGVQVLAGNQTFEGDMSGSVKFVPELPQRKLEGIKRMGYGLLNKVAMLFSSTRGEFFLFYSYSTVSGGPLLLALVAGEAALKFENMPPVDAVSRVLQILKGNKTRLLSDAVFVFFPCHKVIYIVCTL
ncbi:Protein FLOWERING LOCUS D [Linum perenne]